MPLPPPGKTPWPPVQFAEPFADMDVWRAWYSGDTAHLAQVYGGPGSYAQNPMARDFFDLNKPSQFRGGIVGGLARMFWGEPVTPGQPAAKLHVPIAADIAELSANLLWADIPTVTVDTDSATDTAAVKATTDQIKRYLDDRGHSTMREGAEQAAALSGVYVRVVWDLELRPRLSGRPPAGFMLCLDFCLELEQSVEHVLRPRGAPGNVDVHRDEYVDPHERRVIVVEPTGAGADTERNDPLGLGHLVVDALQHGRHFLADRAHHEEHVRLARRKPREASAEPVDIVMRAGRRHVLHPAAGRHKRILEDRVLSGPPNRRVEPARHESCISHHCHSRAPLSHA